MTVGQKNMITKLDDCFMLFITMILNIIFVFHIYPTEWRKTIINAIYKLKGLRNDSANYRPVALVKMLEKIFDFILVKRFVNWFVPADSQTAYQSGKSCADHVFFMRAIIQYARKSKIKIFLIAIDFDGAFDRVSRSKLIKKLVLFGSGTIFTICIASMYMSTDYIIFQNKQYREYSLYAGIKQGLPLSPLLFLFYINDVFDFFNGIYGNGVDILNKISILIHADDVTLLATCRDLALSKLKSMQYYCDLNKIIPQYKKLVLL